MVAAPDKDLPERQRAAADRAQRAARRALDAWFPDGQPRAFSSEEDEGAARKAWCRYADLFLLAQYKRGETKAGHTLTGNDALAVVFGMVRFLYGEILYNRHAGGNLRRELEARVAGLEERAGAATPDGAPLPLPSKPRQRVPAKSRRVGHDAAA